MRGACSAAVISILLCGSGAGVGCARPAARCPGDVPHASELTEQTELERYDVEGRSIDELRRALDARGPLAEDGRRYAARTTSQLCLASALDQTTGRWCRATAIRVQLRTTYVLPRWVRAGDAGSEVIDWWSSRLARLQAHEDVHRALGVDAARTLFARASAAREAPTCEALGRRLEALLDEVTAELARTNATLDRLTDHGSRGLEPLAVLW